MDNLRRRGGGGRRRGIARCENGTSDINLAVLRGDETHYVAATRYGYIAVLYIRY